MAPAPQYPLLQSSTQQPTVTHVYTGHLSNVLPQQSVSYAMPAQSNGSQANDLTGFDPITSAQQYWLPHPFVQQSAGGQAYPGQLMNVSLYQPGSHGMPPESSGASSVDTPGVHLKKMSLPTFSSQKKDSPEFKTVWKQLAEGAIKNKTALAHELKRSVKGEASQTMKSVYVTKPEAYDGMWRKLEATTMISVPLFKRHWRIYIGSSQCQKLITEVLLNLFMLWSHPTVSLKS